MTQHSLTQDPWFVDANPELGLVSLSQLYNIERACYAIAPIARLVGNSASEPDATGAQPLDAWTVAALLGGVLCEHMGIMTEAMLETARAYAQDADCADPTRISGSGLPRCATGSSTKTNGPTLAHPGQSWPDFFCLFSNR
ncbi:hypothetical protein [Achromobacter sp. ACM05]|uniref:hypothetical protein n=1 Tax=Achromobacter sp. ACM05 TaxID=2854776 RepID=UPI00351CCA2F